MPRDVIVHMFNRPYAHVQSLLSRLEARGFSHILISPPAKSHSSPAWWGRYQPVDFTVIEGPLGSRQDLESLCREANGRGLAVVVDTVLNHMSNEPAYLRMEDGVIRETHFPRFGRNEFWPRCAPSTSTVGGSGPDLPELNTNLPYVRQELRDYLRLLQSLGVKGFRFHGANRIEPDFFHYVLEGLNAYCFAELVYTAARDIPGDYLSVMRAFDFPLARTLKEAFAPEGDLGRLVDPFSRGEALWGPVSVTFVNHHELLTNPAQFSDFLVTDPRDRQLAYAYIFGREDGTPFVQGDDYDLPEVEAGIRFHNLALGDPAAWIEADRNVLVWRRGQELLAAINKSAEPWDGQHLATGLLAGRYRDWVTGHRFRADNHGRLDSFCLPPRTAMFLVGEWLKRPRDPRHSTVRD